MRTQAHQVPQFWCDPFGLRPVWVDAVEKGLDLIVVSLDAAFDCPLLLR
jgi:hypothetical protein